jgi:hypothetical protein|tara:strand:- start:527 stop:718 length:192 start_codon:yes stop_codon:yes gene_type:complete
LKLSDVIEAYESSKKLGYDQSYEQFVRDLVNQPQVLPIYDFLDNFFGDYKEGGIVSLFRRRAT